MMPRRDALCRVVNNEQVWMVLFCTRRMTAADVQGLLHSAVPEGHGAVAVGGNDGAVVHGAKPGFESPKAAADAVRKAAALIERATRSDTRCQRCGEKRSDEEAP